MRLRDLAAATVWGLACAVGASQLAVALAWGFAFVGGFVGFFASGALATTRLRTPLVLIGGWLLMSVLRLFSGVLSGAPWLSGLLGAEPAYLLNDALNWFWLCLFVPGGIHFLSARYPSLVALEVAGVSALLASPFAAHREGFINRPYFLVDPLWSRGYDPVPVLLAVGALAAGVMVVLTIGRTTRRSSPLDVALMLLVIAGLFMMVPEDKLRDLIPEPKGAMGLTGKARPKPAKPNQKQGGQGQKPPGGGDDEMPMQDQNQGGGQSPVAVVLLRDDYDPPYGYYYFRSTAFSQFNGKRLVADTTGRADLDLLDHFPVEATPLFKQSKNPYGFQSLRTTVALLTDHPKPFGLADPILISPAENPNPRQFVRAYDVDSSVLTVDLRNLMGSHAGSNGWSPEVWKHYREIPNDPRYTELAQKIVDTLPVEYRQDDFAKAVAIKLYLDKTVTYALDSDHDGYPDPVAHYLFENPRGYCVHQAHAAVYLMRAAGLPARVGAGYASDARNRAGGSTILLRSGDSHAWPEVYFEGLGWLILDISPEKNEVPQMEQPDAGLQRMLGEMARQKESKDKEEQERDQKKSVQELLREKASDLGKLGLGLLLALLGGLYVGKLVRRLAPLVVPPGARTRASYLAALDELADQGLVRGYGQGRSEFARALQSRVPSLAPLTDMHLADSLGRTPGNPEQALELYRKVLRELAAERPYHKRLVGYLNPIAWLRVK